MPLIGCFNRSIVRKNFFDTALAHLHIQTNPKYSRKLRPLINNDLFDSKYSTLSGNFKNVNRSEHALTF